MELNNAITYTVSFLYNRRENLAPAHPAAAAVHHPRPAADDCWCRSIEQLHARRAFL